jgi:hypothetical protein
LFSAEPDLVIASLALASIIRQVLEGDLLDIRSPCMRKYGIWRNIVYKIFGQAKVAITFSLQKTHVNAQILGVVEGNS